MRHQHTISLNASERLLHKAGVVRISQTARETFSKILEKQAIDLGKKALHLAEYSGRKTVKDADILFATTALRR